jgi:hypothetical protein
MSTGFIATASLGNGTTSPYATDIVVKDLDLDVSNRVKDDTPVLNMCMAKKRKVVSTLPLWTNDVYRLPQVQAQVEGAAVSSAQVEQNSRANLGNYTQIFSTVIGATGTARAVEQSGGDPQAYQEVKQLIELMFDVEAQIVRADQIGTKYSGQSGTATGAGTPPVLYQSVANGGTGNDVSPNGTSGASNTGPWGGSTGANVVVPGNGVAGYSTTSSALGRRFGSLNSFAGTHSFNPAAGTTYYTIFNSESSDSISASSANAWVVGGSLTSTGTQYGSIYNNGEGMGSSFYSYTGALQQFAPSLYKQLVTTAEQRFNAKIRTIVCPTSLRTHLSDTFPTSRSINRVNAERGDTIATYEGDFNYTYEIFDSWIMDQVGAGNQIYFLNEEVLQWGSLRDLGPNNEVFSNADASLDQFILEGTLIVRNPAGVAVLHDISTQGTSVAFGSSAAGSNSIVGAVRSSSNVVRLNAWDAASF